MHFVDIVFAVVFSVVINLHSVHNQEEAEAPAAAANVPIDDVEVSAEQDTSPADKHTFVALIDIVFTDGSKKSCTGAVIHDNVVITAAHCFIDCTNEYIQPELTLSFVVIGTKKMFDAGYEQYLPIERVVSHPKFKGWTADLALVYTFSGMMSDKPGKLIPLAGERSATPVDSNVTVISWGKCSNDFDHRKEISVQSSFEDHQAATKLYMRENTEKRNRYRGPDAERNEQLDRVIAKMDNEKTQYRIEQETGRERLKPYYHQRAQSKKRTTKRTSRYLSIEELEDKELLGSKNRHRKPFPSNRTTKNKRKPAKRQTRLRTKQDVDNSEHHKTYKNWRRQMGSQQNELTVEVFGFVNVLTCKKLVERAMAKQYAIQNQNEILCYSSEDHYITKEDSGAPALQQGQLVAVTVGGVETDGDHIAVGMKMSCFCPWIAENLPDGGEELKCCKNCCDTKHFENEESNKNGKPGFRYRKQRAKKFYNSKQTVRVMMKKVMEKKPHLSRWNRQFRWVTVFIFIVISSLSVL